MQLSRQSVPCPNCGQASIRAEKCDAAFLKDCLSGRVTSIECPTCDYLLIFCSLTGAVVEGYAPGIKMSHWKIRFPQAKSASHSSGKTS